MLGLLSQFIQLAAQVSQLGLPDDVGDPDETQPNQEADQHDDDGWK